MGSDPIARSSRMTAPMEPKPDITPGTLITAAVTLVVVLIAVGVLLLMPSGIESISDMEYSVWSAILGPGNRIDRRIVVVETCALVDGRIQGIHVVEATGAFLDSEDLDPGLRGPCREAVNDFRRKCATVHDVRQRFSPETQVELLPPRDRDAILDSGRVDYEQLRRRFGEDLKRFPSLVRFSRVGFSRDGRMALAYWSQSRGTSSGHGWFGFLRWTGSGWERAVALVTWMS